VAGGGGGAVAAAAVLSVACWAQYHGVL